MHVKKKNQKKKFQTDWLSLPEFKGWLKPVQSDPYRCRCIAFNTELLCGKSELQKHAKGAKHQSFVKMKQKNSTLSSMFKSNADSQMQKHKRNVKEAEIKLAIFSQSKMLHFK